MNKYDHHFRWSVLLAALGILLCGHSLAQTTVAPGALELDEEHGVAAIPGDIEEETSKTQESEHEFVIAPLPSRSPLLGWKLSVPVMMLYKPSFSTEQDSTWITGMIGFYAESESWGVGAFHKMSLGGDKWRFMGAAFSADLNYDYYGIGGGFAKPIPVNQSSSLVMVEALRRVYPDLYLGLRGTHVTADTSLVFPGNLLPPGLTLPGMGKEVGLVSLAPRIEYDTRDNQFYPRSGSLLEGRVSLGRESLGGDVDYDLYQFEFNHYRTASDAGIFALRMASEYLSGDAPFFLFPAFGSGADLRGYQTGTYRDRFLFAGQVEYRHRFTPRIGVVGFAGIGTVASGFGKWGESLTSFGAGFRWVIAPKNDMSLRVDIARGKDETQFYIGVGEAF